MQSSKQLSKLVRTNASFSSFTNRCYCFAVTYFVVFVERGQRRIRVEYAKRQQGRQILGGHSTHLPLKVNMANVMPAIFASSIILFPATLTQWFGQNDKFEWLNDLSMLLNQDNLYISLFMR